MQPCEKCTINWRQCFAAAAAERRWRECAVTTKCLRQVVNERIKLRWCCGICESVGTCYYSLDVVSDFNTSLEYATTGMGSSRMLWH